jgi:hypothetical protein
MFAAEPHNRGRGARLLVEHCAALARLDHPRRAPLDRLEALVGHDLAHVLVHGLAGGPHRPLPSL